MLGIKFIITLMLSVLLITSLAGCGSDDQEATIANGDECGLQDGQSGVKICSFVATPTVSESITLKNYDATSIDLTGWTLWDANALGNGSGSDSLTGFTIPAGSKVTIRNLPFQINDFGETITLKDSSDSVVDQKNN